MERRRSIEADVQGETESKPESDADSDAKPDPNSDALAVKHAGMDHESQ
jgi:hypothetical protein